MFNILNKYLLQHKSISIPGMGSLVAETIPAVTDFTNHRLLPVRNKFRFDKYFDAPDREFFSYLASQQNIADFEAIRWYNEFAYDLRHKIRTEHRAVWEGIGIFTREEGGDIGFEAFPDQYPLYAPVAAERVIHPESKHLIQVGDQEKTSEEMTALLGVHEEEEKKDTWWIPALVLGLVGLALLAFFFLGREIKWGATGSRQQVPVEQPISRP